MADVHVITVGIRDYLGERKTLQPPLYLPAATTVATINTLLGTMLPLLDAVIDGKIEDVSVQLALTLPGGLKGSAVTGKDVHNGANLTFDPADTNFAHSFYVPTWEEAGFSGQTVVNSGDYSDLFDELVADNFTDKDGNTFDAYVTGNRTRRK